VFIILEKLYGKYERYTNIGNVIGTHTLDKLKRGELPKFETLYKKLDLEGELGYTYEDFLSDYQEVISGYKEKKALYNIWCTGLSIYEYTQVKEIGSSQLYRILERGREISKNQTLETIIDILDVDITQEDLENFTVTITKDFCKLIGDKEELINFKERYNITNPVLHWQGIWQLAFDGVIAKKVLNFSK